MHGKRAYIHLLSGCRFQVGTSPERTVTTAGGSLPMLSSTGLRKTFLVGMLRLLDAMKGREQALNFVGARY